MPANEKLAPRAIVKLVNARHGTKFTMLSRAPAGESGAYFLREPSGKRFVLKFGSGIEFQPELGAELTSRLRALGYPAPVYVVVGCHEGVSYAVQELMPGAPQQNLTNSHVRQLISLNRLQAGLGHGLPAGWPSRAVDGVLKGFSEYCVIETLARHSAATAALLASLQAIVDRHSRDSFVTNDIVHWDFNSGNILADETRITGVVDWDGACGGDRGFDLATLMFYSYEVRHIREPLWREAISCSGVAALSIYIAHMIVRQVDWSIRYHPAETVNRYLEISGRLLGDLATA